MWSASRASMRAPRSESTDGPSISRSRSMRSSRSTANRVSIQDTKVSLTARGCNFPREYRWGFVGDLRHSRMRWEKIHPPHGGRRANRVETKGPWHDEKHIFGLPKEYLDRKIVVKGKSASVR